MSSGSSMHDIEKRDVEKTNVGSHIETIHTNERVPGHPNYYEKDGLRTYGDDEDHDHEPPVCPPEILPVYTLSLTRVSVDLPADHELGCNGFLVDWKPDSCLHIRYVRFVAQHIIQKLTV